jgi:ArsR family metal-binding transcriptional regulator
MGQQRTFQATEQLIPNKDYSDKKKALKTPVDGIRENDERFYSYVNKIIINEEQKGKIIDAMKKETAERMNHDEELCEDINEKINKAVNTFNEQVADMKEQRISVTYEDHNVE